MTNPAEQTDAYDPTVPPVSPGVYDLGDVRRIDVTFPSDGFVLAGHLYAPPRRSPTGRHPAVVLDGPMPSIKELTVPVYAIRLARAGFLTLTFDRRGWGASEGQVRQHMNPPDNIRDIRHATTYLLSREDVHADRVAAVGVCTGAGFVLQAGAVDRRYRAVACVAGMYGTRRVLRDLLGHDGWVAAMRARAEDCLADLRAGRPRAQKVLAPSSAPPGTALVQTNDEGYDFYIRRQREIAPQWQNLMTYESMLNLLEHDAVPYAALVTPTPLLVVHGTVDPQTPPKYAQEVYDTAHEPKTLTWIRTTNHVQLYDVEPTVSEATDVLVSWLGGQLAP